LKAFIIIASYITLLRLDTFHGGILSDNCVLLYSVSFLSRSTSQKLFIPPLSFNGVVREQGTFCGARSVVHRSGCCRGMSSGRKRPFESIEVGGGRGAAAAQEGFGETIWKWLSWVKKKLKAEEGAPAESAATQAELVKLRKQLEEAQEDWKDAKEAVKRWAKEVEDAFQQFKKEEDLERKAMAQKMLVEAKESLKEAAGREARFFNRVDMIKAEIAAKATAGKCCRIRFL